MNKIIAALTLWDRGLASNDDVIEWADNEILNSEAPSQELIDLSLYGPERCMKWARFEFPSRPLRLDFPSEFYLRARFVDLGSDDAIYEFADWASRWAMGEDLSAEAVIFSYHLEHLIVDCDDKISAINFVREKLPSVDLKNSDLAISLLKHVPDLKLINPIKNIGNGFDV